jgi:hypothetical protein
MHPKRFAMIGGILMLIVGALAFVPALNEAPLGLPVLNLDTSYGLFLGLFPMNVLNKLALIIFGVLGILAASRESVSLPMSIRYSRIIFYIFAVVAILGIFPQTNTLFGYWPLYGNEVWSHGIVALIAAYFGFSLSSKAAEHSRMTPQRDRPAHGI